ncbi:histidinol-phosphatase HisJ [Paenibacillus sp. LHD-117]|uniref:histidinol-phosphatase HisJ n=1 Tax=Paenibacillus sp. LHD-117 TaxID=3071412 RepID=UPI0027DEFF9A|nr:histidinol-phosphatase HisJ [Paenibacillus sp. LHD-117]MDQ6419727.1 histidinol-phosphatase HisJ [Paenibacillus sp. LHD-117]
MLKWDGHTHTRFCYHGSDAEQELYIERAIELGFERYTISEHPPLPAGWIDDRKLMDELAMPMEEMPEYLAYAKEMKRRYEGRIEIAVGLEIDYLPGAPEFTEQLLERWGGELEDVVYSVHYLPGIGGMRCIDFTPEDFRKNLLAHYGTMDRVANEYHDHVEEAIKLAAKLPMRKRIGHINLIEKFSKELPPIEETLIRRRLEGILPLLESTGVGIDVNTAGLRVPTCGKPYVPEWFLEECLRRGIACVYGSDSHKPEQVGFGYDWFEERMRRG